jgi:predicted nucleic acid-binding protein
VGSLVLPSAGSIYLDAQCVIYSVEKHPDFFPLLRPLWKSVQAGTHEVVTSELTILESLTGPLKRGDRPMVLNFEKFFLHAGIRLLPISAVVLRAAAQLRASIAKLKTPDSIHVATAQLDGVSQLVTNDLDFRSISNPASVLLRDLLNNP